jgi:predicted RNA-binding Zn ribbon-like protein
MTFSFHRGSPALDFAGTVGGRASEAPEERLPDPGALGRWLAEAGLAEGARPTERDLAEARALREAIFRVGADLVAGRALDRQARATLNGAAAELRLGAPRLEADGSVRWISTLPVAFALARLAADAIAIFAAEAERLALCELPGCGALLLSRSRSDRRRWCSKETCGNRAKVAAYRARQRGE